MAASVKEAAIGLGGKEFALSQDVSMFAHIFFDKLGHQVQTDWQRN